MNPQEQFCPNSACHTSGKVGGGNIIVHSRNEKRYRCTCCRTTFSERHGTAVFGIKKRAELFVQVTTLLAHGCPVQAIVAAFELDERTVASWQHKAGHHCQKVHGELVQQQCLDLQHVQADEMALCARFANKVKSQFGPLWMALAIMVSTRLWLGGVVSEKRDMRLIQNLVAQVRMMALCRPLLFAVDGLASYVKAVQLTFRSPLYTGKPGRPHMITWSDIVLVQVVKRRQQGQLSIERR